MSRRVRKQPVKPPPVGDTVRPRPARVGVFPRSGSCCRVGVQPRTTVISVRSPLWGKFIILYGEPISTGCGQHWGKRFPQAGDNRLSTGRSRAVHRVCPHFPSFSTGFSTEFSTEHMFRSSYPQARPQGYPQPVDNGGRSLLNPTAARP